LQDALMLVSIGMPVYVCYIGDIDVAPWLAIDARIRHITQNKVNDDVLAVTRALRQLPIIQCGNENDYLCLAQALRAHKIIIIRAGGGLYHKQRLLSQISYQELDRFLQFDDIFSGDVADLLAYIAVLPDREQYRVHFIGYHVGSLLGELLTDCGSGTMLYQDSSYHKVRRATKADAGIIDDIIRAGCERGECSGTLTADVVSQRISEFYVFTFDGTICACCCVTTHETIGVVQYLVSSEEYAISSSLIRELLRFICEEFNEQHITRVVLEKNSNTIFLSMSPWFLDMGFRSYQSNESDSDWIQTINVKPPFWVATLEQA